MEQILDSCCGFLHDNDPRSEPTMISRFMDVDPSNPDREVSSTLKRRAFLVTSNPVDSTSTELVPGKWALTLTPWDPAKVKEHIETAHHVKPYTKFYSELILGKTVHNVAGFDGDMEPRQEAFDKLLGQHPKLPVLCILSNMQHEYGEPFLIKNGFVPKLRCRNVYWYDNPLTIFTRQVA